MLLHLTTNGCLIPLIKYNSKKCIVNLLSPNIHVVVNSLSQVIVVFLLFLGMATYIMLMKLKQKKKKNYLR